MKILLIPLLALIGMMNLAHALTFTVNSTADTADSNIGDGVCAATLGVCTLRAAIQESNTAPGGPHTINLPAGQYIIASPLVVNMGLNLVGAGHTTTAIRGGFTTRVFTIDIGVNNTAALNISNVTISQGITVAPNSGAGMWIRSNASVGSTTINLTRVSVSSNTSRGSGGGIYLLDTSSRVNLNITDSTIANNTGDNGGGGLFALGGNITISGSAIYSNRAAGTNASGAGIALFSQAVLNLSNSTLSGNSGLPNLSGVIGNRGISKVDALGSGLSVTQSTANLDFVTIAANTGASQVEVSAATFQIKRSIIAAPGNNTTLNCTGVTAAHSQGNNLDDGTTCNFAQTSDIINRPANLGALAMNGGLTPTHELLAGSPAINTATNTGAPANDQRGSGFVRQLGPVADMGAFEAVSPVNSTLTVSKSGTGTGTVTATGINCGADCAETVATGTQVVLTATASTGSTFVGWSGGLCTGSGSCTVDVNNDSSVNAIFNILPTVTLTTTKSGTGSGTVTGTGINCGADCSEVVSQGTVVTLTATPASGSSFIGWSGGSCSGTATCTVTLNAATSVSAQFDLTPPSVFVLTTNKQGTGTGLISGTGINCGSDCTESLTAGTSITLTATSSSGSTFGGWTGGSCSGTGTCTVTVNAATTVTAQFDLIPPSVFVLTTTKQGTGSGVISGTGINCGSDCTESVTAGTIITLTATPTSGHSFVAWSGACSGSGTCTVTLNANQSVTAQFDSLPAPSLVTVVLSGTGTGVVSGTGINCGSDCTELIPLGNNLTLSATAAPGSRFVRWSGVTCLNASPSANPCTIPLSSAITVVAIFETIPLAATSVPVGGLAWLVGLIFALVLLKYSNGARLTR